MKKKFLAMLLTLIAAVALLTVGASAADLEVGAGKTYTTVKAALSDAQDGDIIKLVWNEGDAPIAMNGYVSGKTVTITGTAKVDWEKEFLFVGRTNDGTTAADAKLIFDNATLTAAPTGGDHGIHVSGAEKGSATKANGTVEIINSNIQLTYLINKGSMTLDNSALTVKSGFSVGGRPASETESGKDATATLTLNNGSKLVVDNHNGMGLGYEAIGVMNVNGGSSFETTRSFLVTAKGTMNVNGGTVKVDGTLTNNGTIVVSGESTIKAAVTGSGWVYMNGVSLDENTVLTGAKVGFINGTNNIVGSTIDDGWFSVGIGNNDAATATAAFAQANGITLGDVTVNVSGDAVIGSGGSAYNGWVGSAYSADKTQHKYALNIKNSLATFGYLHVSKDGTLNVKGHSTNKYTQDGANVDFYAGELIINGEATFDGTDAWSKFTKMSVDHADGVLNITNGTNYEASIHNGSTTGTALEFWQAGEINVGAASKVEIDNATILVAGAELNIGGDVTAKGTVTGAGTITLTDLAATLAAADGLTVSGTVDGYTPIYESGTYKLAKIVAKIDETPFVSLQAAIDAAVDGDTITLLADVEITETLDVSYNSDFDKINVVIDGNGKTIKAAENWVGNWMVDVAWNVTLKDVTIDGNNVATRGLQFYTSESTLENVTIKNMTQGWGIAMQANASDLTITGDLVFDNCTASYIAVSVGGSLPAGTTSSVDATEATGTNVAIVLEANSTAKVSESIAVVATAKIGTVYYASLQEAIDAAIDGDTIILVNDCAEDVVVEQAADFKITIDGAEKVMSGTITVDGKSARYDTTALTIQNLNFVADSISKDACINLGVSGNNNTRYTNHVTVKDCDFDVLDAVAIKSYTGGDKNLVVTGCTVSERMHSLMQVTNVEEGLIIDDCEVYSKNGINLNSSAGVVIKNSVIDVRGYAVRAGVSSAGSSGEIELTNNTLKTDDSEGDAVVVIRGTAATDIDLTMTKNVVIGDTHISGTTADTQVSADANYWNGEEAPVVSGTAIEVASYYEDAELENLVLVTEDEGGNPVYSYSVTFEIPDGATVAAVKDSNGNTCAMVNDAYILAPGTYTVTVSKDGYYDATEEFTVVDTSLTVTVELEKIPTAYRITVAEAENGTVETDYKSARAGRKVTVTVAADEKYVVKGLTVTTATGREIAVTDKGDGTYTFTMPGAAATITAEFAVDLPFTDIEEDHHFTEAIEWVYTEGLMIGKTETTFDRASEVTRQQVWRVLARVITGEDTDGMAGAKEWAIEQGISDGTRPGEAATREEFITMMWIAFGKPEADAAVLEKFSDADAISADAKTAMAWAVEVGITEGYADGTMRPAATTSRGAFAAVLYRYLAK